MEREFVEVTTEYEGLRMPLRIPLKDIMEIAKIREVDKGTHKATKREVIYRKEQ